MAETQLDAEALAERATESGVNKRLVAWMEAEVEAECARVGAAGGRVLPVGVRNFAMARLSAKKWLNRIEFATNFDFARVTSVLVSDATAVPPDLQPRSALVFVVLVVADSSLPLLAPYIFSTAAKRNDLHHWAFINTRLEETRHDVEAYVEIGGDERDGDAGVGDDDGGDGGGGDAADA